MSRMKRWSRHFALVLLAVMLGGCTHFVDQRQVRNRPRYGAGLRFKPVVAVDEFQNRSGFSGQWDLGSGMSEMLTTQLLESDEFIVLERRNLDSVLGEIIRQGQELFRSEGRVQKGRLKNARYLISGAITDFTVVGDASGWFGYDGKAEVRGGGKKARVSLHLRLTDVQSGEVMSSVSASATASSGWFGAAVNYHKIAFGGDAFFRTPLGRATEEAIADAVRDIARDLPREYWVPRVADAGVDMVVLNGGENVGVKRGDRFVVMERGREIMDPVTGNLIEQFPGKVLGRVEVTDVKRLASHAVILEGTCFRGALLEAER